jgi:hypothetical protein
VAEGGGAVSINLKRYASAMSSLTIERVTRSCGHTSRTGWHNRPQLSGPVHETLRYERMREGHAVQ